MTAFKVMAAGSLSLLSTFAALAAEEEEAPAWSANVTLTSDYRFRGQSQADRGAAVQGGIDYTHPSGLFAGLWASSIDFNDAQKSPAEVDFTGGYSFSLAQRVTLQPLATIMRLMALTV